MSGKTVTSLSTKRILISLFLLFCIPAGTLILNIPVGQIWISRMVVMNIAVSLLIMYDWNLFGIHYNRSKQNLTDTLVYTLTGAFLLALWHRAGANFLNAAMLLPERQVLRMYGYARPGMLIAFSFMKAAAVNIGFKVITDRFDVRGREIQGILVSAILWGFLITLSYAPLSPSQLIPAYLYNLVQTGLLSYLYNQSHSFIPGILAMTLVSLGIMLISLA